ncbi:TIR domain-containing protein [Archangium lansingense]|uniref:TIR domain-containing protein n=1 Tax=Archangium lansingense TaxID=2995310 RepID=A0ABT4A3Y2_9BACT|nr:TIR domain-containing protein [Archangium lansinium]MCY1075979.1 TIR domain-containing protein [Archangium lansinium]
MNHRPESPLPAEQVDALIVTAVKVEYDAVLQVDAGAVPGSAWEVRPGPTQLDVAFRDFQTAGGGRLRVAVTRTLEMGGVATVNVTAPLVQIYRPRCVAMSGVCAGRKGEVELGDVIIADRLWTYDTGKLVVELDASGQKVERVLGDMLTYNLHPRWKQRAESFQPPADSPWLTERPIPYEEQMDWVLERLVKGEQPESHPDRKVRAPSWTRVLEFLWKKGWLQEGLLSLTEEGRRHIKAQLYRYPDHLPMTSGFQVHVAPIATGSKVVKDPHIFEKLSGTMRTLLGLEMEASAIGAVAHLHQVPYMLVMKGVMDFADSSKSDHFKAFAARASAECLLGFLRENLPEGKHPSETAQPVPLYHRVKRDQVFISYCPKDSKWLARLETNLKPLVRNGAMDVWSDKRIQPGANRRAELEKALARARIAVLLVTPDYLASDMIDQQELTPLLKAAEKEEAAIFWLPVKHTVYQYTELINYQPLLDPLRPLSTRRGSEGDKALSEIIQKIMDRLKD